MGLIKSDFLVLREVLNGCGSALGFQETVALETHVLALRD